MKPQRQDKLKKAHEWIADSLPIHKMVYTDEKRFNLDGPDSWSSWMGKNDVVTRNKRQQGGGNVQIWGMLLPNHTLVVFQLHHRSNSKDYIKFLSSNIKPILDAQFDGDYIFQQDDASIHVSAKSLDWMDEVGLERVEWPSKSPDLNIIENCGI